MTVKNHLAETTSKLTPLARMMRYILRYPILLVVSIVCSFAYAGLNAFSVYLIGPFLEKLFLNKGSSAGSVAPVAQLGTGWLGQFVHNLKAWLNHLQYSLKDWVNDLLGSGTPREVMLRLCLLIIGSIILKNVFAYLQGYFMAFVEQGVIRDIRNDLYAAYHRLPLRYFQRRKTGELISRVTSDCNTINNNLNSALIDLMKEPISMAVLVLGMLVISWRLTLLTFFVAPPILAVIMRIGKKLRRRTTSSQDRIADVTSVLEETIAGVRIVKAFAMERFEVDRFKKANAAYYRSLLRLFWLRRLSPPVTEILGVAMATAVLGVGGILVLEKGWLEPGAFFQFLVFMFVMMQSAKRLSDIHVKIQVGVAASDRVFEIIDHPAEIADPPDPLPLAGVREGIRFNHVSYAYDAGVPVLHDITIDVRAGETLAIVGPSGGGKSTLMDLLPRFFDPTEGSVEIDGQDIRRYRVDDLRGLMGIVTQETILFHDTIRANIAYGRPDIPLEQIIEAARAADAHDFISAFPKGYDTVMGDRGTTLSGGQRQRIVIARAILKNPPILILDEATSALDSSSEAQVQAALDRLVRGRTTLVIAHRLSTVQNAHRIVVIEHGRIVEEGAHKDLYRAGNLYRRLYDLQFSAQQPVTSSEE